MEPLLVGAGFLAIAIFLIAHYQRSHRFHIQIEEAKRQQRLSEREHEARDARGRQLHEQHANIRREARERARIAFPELLDTQEAEGFDPDDPALDREFTQADYELIDEAEELVRRDMEALEAANPGMHSVGAPVDASLSKWLALYDKMETLKVPCEDEKPYEKASLYLGTPEWIIDCGEAGRINFYTATQVQRAQEESGVADYLKFLERRAAAPELARQIVERATLFEQKKREAEEAHIASITTKLDELPPLPVKERY